MTLAIFELASGSEVPRPTTMRRVSWRCHPSPARASASAIAAPAAPIMRASKPRSRPKRMVIPGCSRLVAVEHGGHVVLDVARGEQHAGDREDLVAAARAQFVEALADDRPRELEETPFHLVSREPRAQLCRDRAELRDRLRIPAAVAAEHDAHLAAHPILLMCAPLRGAAMAVPPLLAVARRRSRSRWRARCAASRSSVASIAAS